MNDDLLEQLRDIRVSKQNGPYKPLQDLCHEAAERIEALESLVAVFEAAETGGIASDQRELDRCLRRIDELEVGLLDIAEQCREAIVRPEMYGITMGYVLGRAERALDGAGEPSPQRQRKVGNE